MVSESAGLAECRQLYELSGWQEEDWDDYYTARGELGEIRIPAYTLDTLHGMLPAHALTKWSNATWHARWVGQIPGGAFYRVAITAESRTNPVNALARLAIKLFEAGVLLGPDASKRAQAVNDDR